ncbi:hypothetical protein [Kibdelosporangium aridum]|uniref:hypothetical protein n=1 Tax=Kibdelosporangium aridum TaxID=2030 RepID=UPI0035ECD5E8
MIDGARVLRGRATGGRAEQRRRYSLQRGGSVHEPLVQSVSQHITGFNCSVSVSGSV